MIETVTVKGKIYQVGAIYADIDGYMGGLLSAEEDSFKLDNGKDTWFCSDLFEIESCGSIEDAPLELEDGEWYMLCRIYENKCVGKYNKHNHCMHVDDGIYYLSDNSVDPEYKMIKA